MFKDLETLALQGMCSGLKMQDIEEAGWMLRKGKTFEDVKKAFQKGKRNGNFDTEFELEMIELYLGDVLKRNRKYNPVTVGNPISNEGRNIQ